MRLQPVMDRIQFALQKQLKGAYDLSALKLSEEVSIAMMKRSLPPGRAALQLSAPPPPRFGLQSEELSRQKHLREDVGVTLYQVQQQLAKLQMNLEKVHENHSIISQMRESAEGDLSQVWRTMRGGLARRGRVAGRKGEGGRLGAWL